MAYTELIHEYGYEKDEDGVTTGQRVFIEKTGGPVASLPVVGTAVLTDEDGTNMSGCIARSIQVRRNADDRDPQYVVKYSTKKRSRDGFYPDTESRTFDGHAEMVSFTLPENNNWEWDIRDLPLPDGLPLYKRSVLVSFTITHPDLLNTAKNSLISTMKSQAGTINDATFEGFDEGQVLFEGWRGSDYVDSGTVRKWNIELMFTARLLTGEEDSDGNAVSGDDWLYVLMDSYATDSGVGWDKPKAGTKYLYRKTDFSKLEP